MIPCGLLDWAMKPTPGDYDEFKELSSDDDDMEDAASVGDETPWLTLAANQLGSGSSRLQP